MQHEAAYYMQFADMHDHDTARHEARFEADVADYDCTDEVECRFVDEEHCGSGWMRDDY